MRNLYKLVIWILTRNATYAKFWRHAENYGMSEKFFLKAILADILKNYF